MTPLLLILLATIMGGLAGLAVNYLADVLPKEPIQLVEGSWRTLRRQVILALALLGYTWVWVSPPARLGVIGGWFWLAYLLLVVVIDVEHHLILHPVSGVGVVAALITGFSLHGGLSTLLGGAAGAGILYGFYWLGIAYARWSNLRRGTEIAAGDAFGFGDVALGGVMGLLLGWPGVIGGLTIAILLGGLAGLLALAPMLFRRRYRPETFLPYGPFLVAAVFYFLFLFPVGGG